MLYNLQNARYARRPHPYKNKLDAYDVPVRSASVAGSKCSSASAWSGGRWRSSTAGRNGGGPFEEGETGYDELDILMSESGTLEAWLSRSPSYLSFRRIRIL